MFEHHFNRNIQPGEAIVAVVKRHPITMVAPLAFFALLLVLDFFFMALLLRQGWWGGLLFLLVLTGAAVGSWRSVYLWALNAFVLTNQRILDFDQRGLMYRVVSATEYAKIQDVSYSTKGLWQLLFRLGTIHLQTAADQANLELHFVAKPEHTVALINRQMKEARPRQSPPVATQEFVSLLSAMRQALGDQAIDELIQRSRAAANDEATGTQPSGPAS